MFLVDALAVEARNLADQRRDQMEVGRKQRSTVVCYSTRMQMVYLCAAPAAANAGVGAQCETHQQYSLGVREVGSALDLDIGVTGGCQYCKRIGLRMASSPRHSNASRQSLATAKDMAFLFQDDDEGDPRLSSSLC